MTTVMELVQAFVCPNCQYNRLEEIMVDVCVASEVCVIKECGDFDYGEQTNDGGVVDRYQCVNCGFTVLDSNGLKIDDPAKLYAKLMEKS